MQDFSKISTIAHKNSYTPFCALHLLYALATNFFISATTNYDLTMRTFLFSVPQFILNPGA